MNILVKSIFAFSVVGSLVACSKDEPITIDNRILSPVTAGYSQVKSITRRGYFEDAYDWNFTYSANGSMTNVVRKFVHGTASPHRDVSTSASFGFSYGTDAINLSCINTESLKLTLGGTTISKAASGNTVYEYEYLSSGRLASWNSTYSNTGFSNPSTSGASATINWGNDGNISSIVYYPTNLNKNRVYTYKFRYNANLNTNGLMIEGISEALGFKAYDFLYYNGLFGKGTANLCSSIECVYINDVNEKPDTTVTNFTYQYDAKNQPISCEFKNKGYSVIVDYMY